MSSCGVLPSSSWSDEQLAHSAGDGDERAFDVLYRRYRDPLCHYAARLLRDAPAGEDAAQVAFVNAYRALRAGTTPRAVRPWLYGIARNAAWALRAERGDTAVLSEALEATAAPQVASSAVLTAAVAQLPERQRAVFALRELRGASNRETADALGLRESQVEQLLFAGRARLAELLLFGDAVSCDAVRAAATGSLDRQERRALKRHVHHCAECRALVGERLTLQAKLGAPFDAVRRLVEWLLAAAGPAKVVAAAIATAAAVSMPLAHPAGGTHREPLRSRHETAIPAAPHVVHALAPPLRRAAKPAAAKHVRRPRVVPTRPAPAVVVSSTPTRPRAARPVAAAQPTATPTATRERAAPARAAPAPPPAPAPQRTDRTVTAEVAPSTMATPVTPSETRASRDLPSGSP